MGAGSGQNKRVRAQAHIPGGNEGSGVAAAARALAENTVECLPVGALEKKLAQARVEGRRLRVKWGVDPTAPDIHLGHVVVLRKLRQFQDLGHDVVLIIGDFTARIGDPSGRSGARPVLTQEQVAENAATFREQALKVLDEDRTEVRFNSEWLNMPSDELVQVLSATTVAQALARSDFEQRLGEGKPLAMSEIIYPLLQGYDSVAVNADVEVGGTEQKFNLLMGRGAQEQRGADAQVVITMPILVGTDGTKKMSKSEGNYVGVDDEPADMYGKIMSIPDELVADYSRFLLGVDVPGDAPPLAAKQALASGIVAEFHDAEAAEAASAHFRRVHRNKLVPADVGTTRIGVETIKAGKTHLPAVIAAAFGVTTSAARRMIEQGGVRLDGKVVHTNDVAVDEARGRVLQIGKRRFVKLT